jgi:hypothetical protein
MKTKHLLSCFLVLIMILSACKQNQTGKQPINDSISMKLNDFATFRLTADLSKLSENERKMIPLFIEAADIMNEIFWLEAYGNKDSLLSKLPTENERKLALIHYGPWDRMNGNAPLFAGIPKKPSGAQFYPQDMTVEEFESFPDSAKSSLYTLIRRDDQGKLKVIPYHVAFAEHVKRASDLLAQAAQLAEDPGLKKYLELRSQALLTDNYRPSDLAWMDMKTNNVDFVVGPIETYEDQLFGYKAAHEAYILIKDNEWSKKLVRYASLLPALQKGLPVDDVYKKEKPADNSDLGAYDVVYYAGDCNAGSKTIAINLPNDEYVLLNKGSRRLQLKNAMQAKFDKIMIPIASTVLPQEELSHVTFDAFFTNTMLHEIAHGLGCSNTINGKGMVRTALKDQYTSLEEGKADILGLYLESKLKEMGELNVDMINEYTTFMAGTFRSIRFGASSAHGKANLARFNYFKEQGAFTIDSAGYYLINFEKMTQAINSLTSIILTIQGDGDYNRAVTFMQQYGQMDDDLKNALKRIEEKDIPVDIVFEQGKSVLGL